MSAAWLLYSLAVGVLCAAAAWLAEGALRQRGVALRWVWVVALLVTATLTATAPLRRAAPLPAILPTPVAVAEAAEAPDAVPQNWAAGAVIRLRQGAATARSSAVATLARLDGAGATRVVAVAWGSASAALLLAFGAVLVRSHRVRRRWPAAVVEGTPVRISPEAGPFVAGLLRAEIVVPAWLLEVPEAERALVLAHESQHVRARDPALLLAACMIAALLPWHPAVWWMLSRLRLAVELDCDARVLRSGASRGSYGRLLLDLAGRRDAPLLAAPALMDSATHLERRIDAMTTKLPRFALARSAALSGLAGLALLAACEAKMPTAPEIERMDVAAVENSVARLNGFFFGDDANTTYTVDGKSVSKEVARAINANEIGAIEIEKTDTDGVHVNTIQIRTKAALAAAGEPVSEGTRMTLRGMSAPAEGSQRLEVRSGSGPDGNKTMTENFEGLLVIDGVKADPARLGSLAPDAILKMEVLKGEGAVKLYDDPQAKNGVIVITTKPAGAPSTSTQVGTGTIRITPKPDAKP